MAQEVTEKVFSLYEKYGQQDYLGEKVSQIEHATQCALQAEHEDGSVEAILGAFLHDIGHLSGQDSGKRRMVTAGNILGVQNHDIEGETFLQNLGVPPEVTDFIRGHVDAKRYLCYKNPQYHDNLSEASKQTLVHQGGLMTEEEALKFESNPRFEVILRMRTWDERAKVENMDIPPLQKYRTMFTKYMEGLHAGFKG